MRIPQTFNTSSGTFVQMKNDGDPLSLKAFLEKIGSDFFADGWGWDPRSKSIFVPGMGLCYNGFYILCAINRTADRFGIYDIGFIEIQ